MATRAPKPRTGAKGSAAAPLRSLLYVYLHLIGFACSTTVMTWGLFALFFMALGGFSLDGLMHQLHNLSSRYVAAGHERVASFKQIFAVAHILVAGGLIVLRRHRILPMGLSQGSADHG
ncbi:hypothetical protein [Rhizorhapis sp. SPR117]|uniref:hypothetical protein n=1 Tax=Rhizorhapis sp. SPR117 TaxID=2912611 RepID=UPI001F429D33|nr:hypothetical protein [Rhizorhapis sp. SPR117]